MITNDISSATEPDPEITFRFVEFNPRRLRRGVEAVRVMVLVDGVEDDLLWMSRKDIENNLHVFGESPALREALACYTAGAAPVMPSPILQR